MRVVATAVGYDNVTTRQPDEEFDMPDGSVGDWFHKVGEKTKTDDKPGLQQHKLDPMDETKAVKDERAKKADDKPKPAPYKE